MPFENPTPTSEKEPSTHSLEEIQDKMNSIIDTRGERCKKPPRLEKTHEGLVTLIEYEIKNDDGSISLYSYRLVGPRTAQTVIYIADYQGTPEHGKLLDAEMLANYDEVSRKWRNFSRQRQRNEPLVIEPLAIQEPLPLSPVEESEMTPTLVDPAVRRQNETNERAVNEILVERLRRNFGNAEATFGTTSLEKTLVREIENQRGAMEARDATKPLLNDLNAELIRLNKSKDEMLPLAKWNPRGELSESQFNELNLRRKKLSNLVGILHKDPASGKMTIRHDLNDI